MRKTRQVLSFAAAFLFFLAVLPMAETIGAYYSGRTLSYTIVPDLSGVPTPTPRPTETPSPEPTASPTPAPVSGQGLIFSSGVSLHSVAWNSAYSGNFTSASMSVDNANHVLNFGVTFTVPDGCTQQYIKNNKDWFSGFTLRVSGTNQYDGSVSPAGSGSSGPGEGKAQLQNAELSAGQSSSDIRVHFESNNSWRIPSYSESGSIDTVQIKSSYTDIRITTDGAPGYRTERYTIRCTVTLVLPNQALPAIVPDAALMAQAIQSPSAEVSPAPTPTAGGTQEPVTTVPASSTLSPESTTAAPSDVPAVTPSSLSPETPMPATSTAAIVTETPAESPLAEPSSEPVSIQPQTLLRTDTPATESPPAAAPAPPAAQTDAPAPEQPPEPAMAPAVPQTDIPAVAPQPKAATAVPAEQTNAPVPESQPEPAAAVAPAPVAVLTDIPASEPQPEPASAPEGP